MRKLHWFDAFFLGFAFWMWHWQQGSFLYVQVHRYGEEDVVEKTTKLRRPQRYIWNRPEPSLRKKRRRSTREKRRFFEPMFALLAVIWDGMHCLDHGHVDFFGLNNPEWNQPWLMYCVFTYIMWKEEHNDPYYSNGNFTLPAEQDLLKKF